MREKKVFPLFKAKCEKSFGKAKEFRSRSLRLFLQLLSPFTHIGKPCLFMLVIYWRKKVSSWRIRTPTSPALNMTRHSTRRRNFNDEILSFFSCSDSIHKTIPFVVAPLTSYSCSACIPFPLVCFPFHSSPFKWSEKRRRRRTEHSKQEINWDIKLNERKNASTQSLALRYSIYATWRGRVWHIKSTWKAKMEDYSRDQGAADSCSPANLVSVQVIWATVSAELKAQSMLGSCSFLIRNSFVSSLAGLGWWMVQHVVSIFHLFAFCMRRASEQERVAFSEAESTSKEALLRSAWGFGRWIIYVTAGDIFSLMCFSLPFFAFREDFKTNFPVACSR